MNRESAGKKSCLFMYVFTYIRKVSFVRSFALRGYKIPLYMELYTEQHNTIECKGYLSACLLTCLLAHLLFYLSYTTRYLNQSSSPFPASALQKSAKKKKNEMDESSSSSSSSSLSSPTTSSFAYVLCIYYIV